MKNPSLWEKLQKFQFDADSGSQPFSAKLAKAMGWDATYTSRVVEEYRRFLYLAQVADHEVTPSVAVDQAWQMHVTFTRSYRVDLCENILGAPFHHEPGKGPRDMPRENAQYDRTLALYVSEFGHAAPPDIWPDGQTASVVEPSRLRKWLCTWGMVTGLTGSLLALLALVIFGVNLVTTGALAVFGLLILAGVLAFQSVGRLTGRKGLAGSGGGNG